MKKTRPNYKQPLIATCVFLMVIAVGFPGSSFAQEEPEGVNLEEINRQLNNPISDIWSLSLRNTYSVLDGDAVENSTYSNILTFQPVLPIPFGDKILINRPTIPVVTFPQYGAAGAELDHTTGIGDIILPLMLGPSRSSGFIWAAGPSFIFPTASDDALGAEKWQAGPAVLALYMSKDWVVGTLSQQWWSFAGNDDRDETSSLSAQYFIWRILPNAWQVGMAPLASVDWTAESGNQVTLPVGLGVGKTIKIGNMPLKIIMEAVISAPATLTVPASGTTTPAIRFNRVVLPVPLGPMTATVSLGATLSSGIRRRNSPSR